ncbi:MAG: RES family NAD+ phosphorylase, partial [Rhodanobacteraceae bacterium]
ARVLDFTNPKVAELFGYNSMDSYQLTGQLAERAIQMGYDAIKYKSVRGAGDNYAILRLESGAMQPQMIAPSP